MNKNLTDKRETSKQKATENKFGDAIDQLIARDQDLALVIERWGRPKQMLRSPGFATLLRIILGQQVSLTAATSIFKRLNDQLPEITPTNFLNLQAEDGIRDAQESRGLGDVYKRQTLLGNKPVESNLQKQAQAIHSRQIDFYEFRIDNFKGVIRRNKIDRLYIAVWEEDFH